MGPEPEYGEAHPLFEEQRHIALMHIYNYIYLYYLCIRQEPFGGEAELKRRRIEYGKEHDF
jgi:hypothetical protein